MKKRNVFGKDFDDEEKDYLGRIGRAWRPGVEPTWKEAWVS